MKVCEECKENKPLTEYYSQKKRSKKRGEYIYYNPECKDCTIKRSRKRHLENHEEYLEYTRQHHRWNRKHNKKMIEYDRKHAREQKESGYYKKYQEENKEKFRQYQFNHLHKKHDITVVEWDECKSYFNGSCAYCGISEAKAKKECGQFLHMEHAINNGSNDITNCVPACRSCNSKKWIRDYTEWYTEVEPMFSEERLNKIIKWLNEDCYILIT